ncbi:MAG: hypothetical protein SOR61_05690 [Evtepia sp.]|uniref:hypothetical protein n=1 Tax=Evtepia sp. TaxID=2773933 RepID=UPI002A755E0C|nr:hypothetical protein [Evtepia sp.]MDY3014668.1 hypothetical protein [Evtepia sp.]
MQRRKRLIACLSAGLLILAISATAAFGSVNGYTKLKDSLRSLALEDTNFTITGTGSLSFDGKEMVTFSNELALANGDLYTHEKTVQGSKTVTDLYATSKDGVRTSYSADSKFYDVSKYSNVPNSSISGSLFGVSEGDEMSNRLMNFLEVAADTVMGDLKNNFVEVGTENGSTLYKIEISKSQVPSLVNAGLSLFACNLTQTGTISSVTYEDVSIFEFNMYEKATGTKLSDDFREHFLYGFDDAWYEKNQTLLEQYRAFLDENDLSAPYFDVLEEKGSGIILVHNDGSYDYYADGMALLDAHPELAYDYLEYYAGKDITLDNISCIFGVDKGGRLTSLSAKAAFRSVDTRNQSHTMDIAMDLAVSNYGTTQVLPLDVGDRVKR